MQHHVAQIDEHDVLLVLPPEDSTHAAHKDVLSWVQPAVEPALDEQQARGSLLNDDPPGKQARQVLFSKPDREVLWLPYPAVVSYCGGHGVSFPFVQRIGRPVIAP